MRHEQLPSCWTRLRRNTQRGAPGERAKPGERSQAGEPCVDTDVGRELGCEQCVSRVVGGQEEV